MDKSNAYAPDVMRSRLTQRQAERDQEICLALGAMPAKLHTRLANIGVPEQKIPELWIATHDYVQHCKDGEPLTAGQFIDNFEKLQQETVNYRGLILNVLPGEIVNGSFQNDSKLYSDEKVECLLRLLDEIITITGLQIDGINSGKKAIPLPPGGSEHAFPLIHRYRWVIKLREILKRNPTGQIWNFTHKSLKRGSSYFRLTQVITALSKHIPVGREQNSKRLVEGIFKIKPIKRYRRSQKSV